MMKSSLQEGLRLAKSGDLLAAIEVYRSIATSVQQPLTNIITANRALAVLQLKRNEYGLAEKYATKALELSSEDINACLILASVYSNALRYEDA